MYSLEAIRQRASTCTIYVLDSAGQSTPVRGVIEQIGPQFVWCVRGENRYYWYVRGERVSESDVRSLLEGQQ